MFCSIKIEYCVGSCFSYQSDQLKHKLNLVHIIQLRQFIWIYTWNAIHHVYEYDEGENTNREQNAILQIANSNKKIKEKEEYLHEYRLNLNRYYGHRRYIYYNGLLCADNLILCYTYSSYVCAWCVMCII